MFSAVVGLFLFVFGIGMAAYICFGQGGSAFPFWSLELAAAGLGLFLLTAAVYFLRIIQFVRQRGVTYNEFFFNLPLEGEDHPKDAGDLFDDLLDFLMRRSMWLAVPIIALPVILKAAIRRGALRPLFGIDLGSIRNGGTHWSVGDVVSLGSGSVAVVFIVALAIRRIWAMQRDDVPPRR